MLQSTTHPRLFDTPASYRIQVAACLPESWRDVLGGMAISVRHVSDEESISTLTGVLPDQVALAGVLDTIIRYGLLLLSVQRGEDILS